MVPARQLARCKLSPTPSPSSSSSPRTSPVRITRRRRKKTPYIPRHRTERFMPCGGSSGGSSGGLDEERDEKRGREGERERESRFEHVASFVTCKVGFPFEAWLIQVRLNAPTYPESQRRKGTREIVEPRKRFNNVSYLRKSKMDRWEIGGIRRCASRSTPIECYKSLTRARAYDGKTRFTRLRRERAK